MKKTNKVHLKYTKPDDLEALFLFQLDEEANRLAAFTSTDPTDKNAYIKKWTRLLQDDKNHIRTIFLNEEIVGSIAKYEMDGNAEITYWISKDFWGKGVATSALVHFLKIEKIRPIFGRVAFDNIGSKKVLERCGFSKIGTEKGFANARGKVIEEIVFVLK